MILRDYQSDALDSDRWLRERKGARVVCFASPTGSGKTFMGQEWVRRQNDIALSAGRSLPHSVWVAHRRELLDQAQNGWLAGCRFAMVQSAAQTQDLIADSDLVVLDECHHLYGTEKWAQTVAACRTRATLALTATPERGDGAALGNLADAIVAVAQPRQLIAAGHLVACDVIAPAGQVRQMAEHPEAAWTKHAEGKKAIVFCRDVKHAQQVADDFRNAGVPAGCVDGAMPDELRAARLAAHRSGELMVLTNVQLLTEGYDDPSVECAIMACGVATAGAWIQRCGRVVRPYPGKKRAIVIDLRGSVYQWGLPDEDRLYSLEGRAIRVAETSEAIRQCKVCQRVFRAREFQDATCPACGARSKGRPDPKVRREAMAKVLATHTVDDKRRKYQELGAIARAKGYSHKWVLVQFKLRYGFWPDRSIRERV